MHDGAGQPVVVGQVHAVHEKPVVGGQVAQAVRSAGIGFALGHMDVDADTQVGRQPGYGFKGLVGARECSMHTHPAPTPGSYVPLVLGEAPTGPLGPVAVRHPVGAVDPHADLCAGLVDQAQRTIDGIG